jgi:hypothetical protein
MFILWLSACHYVGDLVPCITLLNYVPTLEDKLRGKDFVSSKHPTQHFYECVKNLEKYFASLQIMPVPL